MEGRRHVDRKLCLSLYSTPSQVSETDPPLPRRRTQTHRYLLTTRLDDDVGGEGEWISLDVNADFVSIVPYERQLVAHVGSDSIKKRKKRRSVYVHKGKMIQACWTAVHISGQ